MTNSEFTVDQINEKITDARAFISEQERNYHAQVEAVADRVGLLKDTRTIVMLAGPSGSGKTTTAGYLKRYLADRGCDAQTISLDDFFLGTGRQPKLPNGDEDVETVNALDITLLADCLNRLLETGRCRLPRFDFKTSRPHNYTVEMELGAHDTVIVEGIHAMNPKILSLLPRESVCTLFVGANGGVEGYLSERDIRLIRRMVRDSKFRGAKPERTFELWPNVVWCEEKYLLPYSGGADFGIKTFMGYEPCVLKEFAIPLFGSVEPGEDGYDISRRLVGVLKKFRTVDHYLVPHNSLLREFIG